jgi:hypothetical protein
VATLDRIEYGTASEVSWPELHQIGPRHAPWCAVVPTARGVKATVSDVWPLVKPNPEIFTLVPAYFRRLTSPMKYTEEPPKIQVLAGLFTESVEESSVATATELAEVLAEINNLAFQVEEDEYGLVRPSYHAFKHCLRLVLTLAQRGVLAKPSSISTDPNGAIRIVWTSDDREAELVCPSEEGEAPYIYSSSSEKYEIEGDSGPEALMRKIRWAIGGEIG